MTTAVEAQHIPSYMRSVPGSVNVHVAKFPAPSKKELSLDSPQKVASSIINAFNAAISKQEYSTIAALFTENGYWRDHLALSWQFRTVQGHGPILEFLNKCAGSKDGIRLQKISVDVSSEVRSPKAAPIDDSGEVLGVQFFITLETSLGTGQGLVRLAEVSDGQWRIFNLYTRIQELKGFEETINGRRPKGVEHGGQPGRKNWAERRAAAADFRDGNEPTVLIIGTFW